MSQLSQLSRFLNRLEPVRGLPVLVGVLLVVLNFLVRTVLFFLLPPDQPVGFVLFLLTDGNLLLHLGVVVGLLGVLIGDVV
jgi:hypothetical protein